MACRCLTVLYFPFSLSTPESSLMMVLWLACFISGFAAMAQIGA
jgi:hypothetical protein